MSKKELREFDIFYQDRRHGGKKGNNSYYRGKLLREAFYHYYDPDEFEQFKERYELAKAPTVNNLAGKPRIGKRQAPSYTTFAIKKSIVVYRVSIFGIPVLTVERST